MSSPEPARFLDLRRFAVAFAAASIPSLLVFAPLYTDAVGDEFVVGLFWAAVVIDISLAVWAFREGARGDWRRAASVGLGALVGGIIGSGSCFAAVLGMIG